MANIAAPPAEHFSDTFIAEGLSLAVEAARLGTWQWDIKSNVVLWSKELERIHGLEQGTFAGTFEAFQSDIHPDDRDRVLSTIADTVRERKPHHLEYRILLPDGSTRWLEARGRMFFDAFGEPERLVGVCMDITERKSSEEALRLSEQHLRMRAEELARAGARARTKQPRARCVCVCRLARLACAASRYRQPRPVDRGGPSVAGHAASGELRRCSS